MVSSHESRNDLPIGVFDSGIGGLTVLRNLMQVLPSETFIYLGDTARVPYGNRSEETIVRYAREACGFLVARGVKLIVVACNTVSAVAAHLLQVDFDIPVIGVIESTSLSAAGRSGSGRIGVIGTRRTISTGAYHRRITIADSRCEVFSNPAPLLVPLAEEGIVDGEIVSSALDMYLAVLLDRGIDTIILGCTHYQLFVPAIKAFIEGRLGRAIEVVDSSTCVADSAREFLDMRELLSGRPSGDAPDICVTDDPENFRQVGARFFGSKLTTSVNLVSL
jgi:glutamate racemase